LQTTISTNPSFQRTDHLFVLLLEGRKLPKLNLPKAISNRIERTIKAAKFQGRNGENASDLGKAPTQLTLIGLGRKDQMTDRVVRAAIHQIGRSSHQNRNRSVAVIFPYQFPGLDDAETSRHIADLLAHADYRFDKYITADPEQKSIAIKGDVVAPASLDQKTARDLTREARIIADAVRTVRDLGNGPGNEITPQRLAERAQEVAREAGFSCKVFDKKQIEKMNMGGLLAVNKGSVLEPRFVVMEWAPEKAKKTVALVGKGITFDSGGISIKPSDRMEEMKFDMCGAGAVIGIMQAAANLKVPHRVIGIFATTENLPDGNAYKPGDIIRTMSGKTVEIVNTDAEGRMILSDALHYASTLKPDHIIDFATLTGACVVALGSEASGLFTSDESLAESLTAAASRTGERLWRLPEWDDYKDLIRSEGADVKNSGGRWGGAITAAVFLKEFVSCPSWAHIDIAGTAWAESRTPRDRKGATGVGVRATVEFLRSLN